MMPRTSRHDHESDDDDYERDDNRAHAAAAGVIRGGGGSDDDGAEMSEGGRGGRARGGRDRNGGEEEDRRSRKERKKKTKPKKVRVMEASGQTDQDRRVLRTQQRKLQSKIVNSEAGADIENPNADAFESIREENNRLWDDVRYTREAVLDGDNLELISRRARNQVDRLVQVPRYDAGRFIQKLRGKLVSKAGLRTYFDWRLLGREAGTCFNSVPSRVSFLHGPIDVVYVPKERKKRERRRHEDDGGEEEEVEQIDQKKSKSDADKLSAVERNITIVNTVLNKKTNEASKRSLEAFEADAKAANLDENEMRRKRRHVEKEGPFVDAVQHLFNPKSFTQTVENIFHFSFLVKKGTAAIHLRDEDEAEKYGGMPGPVVRAFPKGTTPCPRQSIVALNMQDWRDMCKAFEVDKCDIPHRKGSKHARSKAN